MLQAPNKFAMVLLRHWLPVRQLLKLFKSKKLENKPRLPKYRKKGLFTVSYPKKWLKLTELGIRVPLGRSVKAWFGLENFYLPMANNLDWEKIKEIRILPRHGCFYVEYVYQRESTLESTQKGDPEKVLGIDHGLDNWLTCVNNVGTSFIVDFCILNPLTNGITNKYSNQE